MNTLDQEQTEMLARIKADPVRRMVFSAYLGETCQGCGKTIDSFEDMMDTVWWPHDGGRIGHKKCYETRKAKEATP